MQKNDRWQDQPGCWGFVFVFFGGERKLPKVVCFSLGGAHSFFPKKVLLKKTKTLRENLCD